MFFWQLSLKFADNISGMCGKLPIGLLVLGAHPPQSNGEIPSAADTSRNQSILNSYIDFAIKTMDDPHWCKALLLGMFIHIKDRKMLRQAIRRLNGKKGLMDRFGAVKDEFRIASWGMPEDFIIIKKNGQVETKAGVYKACSSQDDQDCIFLNPRLAMELGSCQAFKGLPMTYSEVTLLHEGLHKLFEITGIRKDGLIKANKDEKVIEKILRMYFIGTEYSYELKKASQRHNLTELFSACNPFKSHASSAFDRGRGINMSPPVRPKPSVLQLDTNPVAGALDFNNDGIEDFTSSSDFDYCLQHAQGRSYEECEWEFIEPNLRGKNDKDFFWLISYDEDDEACRLPKIQDRSGKEITPVTAWRLPYNVPDVWDWPFMKFRSSDKLMSFKPGQRVALRSSHGKQFDMESPVVFYNPNIGVQVGAIYALLPKCTFVPLDDLIYVTKTGRPLDMRKAFELAESNSAPEATMEWQVAQLIRSAKTSIAALEASPEAKRDIVLGVLKQNRLSADLPDGWEAGMLYALRLPQEEWVRTKPLLDGKTCGFK